ncbi:MAG: CHRD domain-containing protein [Spirochaetaceae bacterium]|nr:CHRD domain-containing protein [Spirochaetaceae bacterium]
MRRITVLAAAVLALSVMLPGGSALAQVPQQQVTLTGAQEVPDAGDPNGRGQFTWSLDGTRLCYLLSVKRIATAAAAHIHRGARGVAGPVKITLVAPAPKASAACVDIAAGLATKLRDNPRRFYVNVHNADFPDGAIRGQLTR